MKRKLSTENWSHFWGDNFRFTFREFAAAIGLAVEAEFLRALHGELETLAFLEIVFKKRGIREQGTGIRNGFAGIEDH